MVRKIAIIMGLLMVCLFSGAAYAYAAAYEQEFVVKPEPILSDGATRLDLRFNIRHGRVTVKLTENPAFIVKVRVRYNSRDLAPASSEGFSEGAFQVAFSSGVLSPKDKADPLHDWEIEIGRYDLETTLTLDFAGVQTDMDLGGMPLDTLTLNLKGTQANLDFSEPTLFSVRKVDIACEGGFFTLANIANTNFEEFRLKATGSSLDLDFKGSYAAGDYPADFSLNGCSARMTLPAKAGARVIHRPENRPVELAGGGWSKDQNNTAEGYMSDDYEERESRLNLDISSTATSVLIKRDGANMQYRLSY